MKDLNYILRYGLGADAFIGFAWLQTVGIFFKDDFPIKFNFKKSVYNILM